MKKIISMLVIIISMLFMNLSAFAATGDKPSSWAETTVNEGINLGIVPERLQSKYQSPITREEFAELIVNAMMADSKEWNFNLPEESHWTMEKLLDRVTLEVEFEDAKQDHVKAAYILGSINGISDTKFAPDKLITRQEAATMLINTSHLGGIHYTSNDTMKYTDYNNIAEWAKPAVRIAHAKGLMFGEGNKFNYNGSITRERCLSR